MSVIPNDELFIGKELNDALPRLLAQARANLRLSAYELNPTSSPSQFGHKPLMPQLESLALSGVTCKCILASSQKSANIRISNTTAAIKLIKSGWQARIAPAYPLQHCKFWIVDDYLAIIGSHNLTISGLTSNNEVSVTTRDSNIIAKLDRFFNEHWEKSKPP